jgi:hypothetical protein
VLRFGVIAEIFDPVAEILLRPLGFDFLRDDVLDVNGLWSLNLQLRMVSVLQKLYFLKAVARSINAA